MKDKKFLELAIEICKCENSYFGAIIVKDGKVLGRSNDITLMGSSMYSHAELMAIESASRNKKLSNDLVGATMYSVCEPCMMCLGAIMHEGINKIVYSISQEELKAYKDNVLVTNVEDLISLSEKNIEVVKDLYKDKVLKHYKNLSK